MTDSSELDRYARQFLLGQLEEHERQQLEKRLMLNAEHQEQMLLAEEALIEDYLAGVLHAKQRKEFETKFITSNPQRRRVRVIRLLANYEARKFPTSDHVQPLAPSLLRRWAIGLGSRNRAVVFTGLVAASLLIIGLAIAQVIQSRRETQRAGIERELAQLNSTPELTASTFVVVLAPLSLRDTNDSATPAIPLTAEVVEIRLVIGQNVNQNYNAELTRTGTAETFNVAGLRAQSTANGQAMVVRFPSRLLSRGDYRLSLIGIANDGRKIVVGEYLFAVGS